MLDRDLDAIKIGDTWVSRGRTVTEADFVLYSALTGDRHPLHVDREWAESSDFGQRVAPCGLVLCYALGLLEMDPGWVLSLVSMRAVTPAGPLSIGDTMYVELLATDKRILAPGRGELEVRLDAKNRAGVPVLKVTLCLTLARRE